VDIPQSLLLPSQPVSTATAPWPVLIFCLATSRKLSWLEWLVTYQDERSPISLLTGLDVVTTWPRQYLRPVVTLIVVYRPL